MQQRCVKRCRLAAAGRSGDQHDAVWPVEIVEERAEISVGKPQRPKVQRQAPTVENSQHHAFAMRRRRGRDTEIDVLAANGQPDTAVLRQPPLGNVEPRHQLDARHDGCPQPVRRRLDVAQNAVDAVPNTQFRLQRFDMNVGCPGFDGTVDQQVDEPNHRCLAGEILQPVNIGVVIESAVGLAGNLIDAGPVVAIEPFERRLDVGHRRHASPHGAVRRHAPWRPQPSHPAGWP